MSPNLLTTFLNNILSHYFNLLNFNVNHFKERNLYYVFIKHWLHFNSINTDYTFIQNNNKINMFTVISRITQLPEFQH